MPDIRRNQVGATVAVTGGIAFDRLCFRVAGTRRVSGYGAVIPSSSPPLISGFTGIVDGLLYDRAGESYAQYTAISGRLVIDLSAITSAASPLGYMLPSAAIRSLDGWSLLYIGRPGTWAAGVVGQRIIVCQAVASSSLLLNVVEQPSGTIYAGVRRTAGGDLVALTPTIDRRGGWAAFLLSCDYAGDRLTFHDLIGGTSSSTGIAGDPGSQITHAVDDLSCRMWMRGAGDTAQAHRGQISDQVLAPYAASAADAVAAQIFADQVLRDLGV